MPSFSFSRCPACERLNLHGQTCVCGQRSDMPVEETPAAASMAELADAMPAGESPWPGMSVTDLVYRYDPTPEPPSPEPGVTKAYLYQWSGEPGPARYTEVALLRGPDGELTIHRDPDAEWRDCTIVDDRKDPDHG